MIVTLVALIYTMMGGITAVIWTDVIQAGVLFVGAIIIFFTYMNFWVTNPFEQLAVVSASADSGGARRSAGCRAATAGPVR